MKIIPAHDTIAELKNRACEYEEKARGESDPIATQLREETKLFRDWIAALDSGKWTS